MATPLTALMEPTERSVGGQDSRWATTVVTAAGGGCMAAIMAMPFLIWMTFHPAIAATTTATTPNMMNILFFIPAFLQERRIAEATKECKF